MTYQNEWYNGTPEGSMMVILFLVHIVTIVMQMVQELLVKRVRLI